MRADCVTTVAEPLTAVAAFAPSREPVLKCRPDIMRLSGPVWRTEPLRPGMKVRGMATSGSARCATRSDSGAEVTALQAVGRGVLRPKVHNCNPFVMQPGDPSHTPCAAIGARVERVGGCFDTGTGAVTLVLTASSKRRQPKRLKKRKKKANDGWEEDKDQGPHLHEQDFGRTIKDEGSMKF